MEIRLVGILGLILMSVCACSSSSSASPDEETIRMAVVNYKPCKNSDATLSQAVVLIAKSNDEQFDGSSVIGRTGSGQTQLVRFYTKSQGGGRHHEYEFSYDPTTGQVSGENQEGAAMLRTMRAAC